MKLRTRAALELPVGEVERLLTEAVCTSFSMFEHMEVYRVTRTKHGNFRLDLWMKQPPVRKPTEVVKAA